MPLPAAEITFVFLLLALVALAGIVWLLMRVLSHLGELPAQMESALAARHTEMLRDLHEGLARQGDRTIGAGTESAERLRSVVGDELKTTRDAMSALHVGLQGLLGSQREESSLRLAELSSGMQARQDQLKADLLGQTLERLSEQSRAERELLQSGLQQASAQLSSSIELLTRTINERLDAIGGRVSERLDEGFKKTNETFASVMARLATIDEAQKKIDGLTTNVVSLQELLGDKKSRGAFGEVQLEALVRNVLPPDGYEFQSSLPNGSRVDCMLMLPEPTGRVAVDSKFPLENYHRMFDDSLSELERRAAQSAFRGDVRKHVDAIASKYIVADYTSDGAVMFVPAEAVFAEIHAYHPEVVNYAQTKRVWIVSPTTLMAVLNTARAVLKDVETRKQIHVIKDALGKLAKDFTRFDDRMSKLATHIRQAHEDAQDVQTSSRKISAHFTKIEHAQLEEIEAPVRLERASE
jgi:DNA recombination protein RmuC